MLPQYRHGFGVQDQWSGERQSRSGGGCFPSAGTGDARRLDDAVEFGPLDVDAYGSAGADVVAGEGAVVEPAADGAQVDAGDAGSFLPGDVGVVSHA